MVITVFRLPFQHQLDDQPQGLYLVLGFEFTGALHDHDHILLIDILS